MIIRRAVLVYASSLIEVGRCHLGAVGAPLAPGGRAPASLREALAARLTDPRKPRGIRHSLGSLVSVLVAGVACGYGSFLATAGAAAGWDPDVLAAHGTRRNPVTGLHEPPSASTLGRLPALLDADELEAGLAHPAIAADYLIHHDTPSAARNKRTYLVHATCSRSRQPPRPAGNSVIQQMA
jgi:DDE_Tnp_1-associated